MIPALLLLSIKSEPITSCRLLSKSMEHIKIIPHHISSSHTCITPLGRLLLSNIRVK